MKEQFIEHKFQAKQRAMIDQINQIIDEIWKDGAGTKLTSRQVFYRFVGKGWCENEHRNYTKVCNLVRDGRETGLIDWDAIEDRTREINHQHFDDDPRTYLTERMSSDYYREDPWKWQKVRPVVAIEKEALVGLIEDLCDKYRVAYLAARGNGSTTLLYDLAQVLKEIVDVGQKPIVLYLGDHDPNGIDMERDLRERLSRFAGVAIEVRRLGLTMEQVRRYRLPPNRIDKEKKDTRWPAYIKKFGTRDTWELDALEPDVITELVREGLKKVRNDKRHKVAEAAEEANSGLIDEFAEEADMLWSRKFQSRVQSNDEDEP